MLSAVLFFLGIEDFKTFILKGKALKLYFDAKAVPVMSNPASLAKFARSRNVETGIFKNVPENIDELAKKEDNTFN